jgi:hypothetical protein
VERASLGLRALSLLGAFWWLTGASCSPKDDAGDVVDQYLDLRGNTLCSMSFKCCSAAEQQEPDMAACQERGTLQASFKELADAVESGTTKIDLDTARACFDEIRAMSCAAWADALSGAVPASCSGIFSGKANGQTCKTDAECSSQFCDRTSGDHTIAAPQPTGLCATVATAGGSCPPSQRGCAAGTQCRGTVGSTKCTPFAMAGETCSKATDCVSSQCTAGSCAAACWGSPGSHHLLGTPRGF